MLALLLLNFCFAQNYETVVEDIVFSSSSRTVITQEMIRKSQARDLPSLLISVANISITSSPFQPTSISIRGGDSGHVLILLDGIPFYDPSTIQRTGNLSSFNIKSIKKIEVIKGSQSVLYGGQALGGVIKIETLGEDNRTAYTDIGTQSLIAVGSEYSSKNLLARGFYKEKRAESSAKHSSQHYPLDQQNVDLAYKWDNGFIKGSFFRDSSFTPSSDINYKIVDVSDYVLSSEQGSLVSQILLRDLKWKPKLSFGLQNGFRFYRFISSSIDEDYKSHTHFFRADFQPHKSDTLIIDFGLSYSYEDFIFQEFNQESADAFLEQRGVFTKFTSFLGPETTLSYGARAENWSHQNPVTVYQIGLAHKKTKAEISSGFKTPTLYQLYSNYGNSDLRAEEGAQISVSQEFAKLSLTVFYSKFKNLINTTGTFPALRYTNVKESETKGSELTYSENISQDKTLSLNLIYQEPKDLSGNTWLLRRPLLNASLRYSSQSWTVEALHIGSRVDAGPNGNVKLRAYTVLNLSYIFNESVSLRIDNLTNNRYQETYGYYAEGAAAILGWSTGF